MILIAVFSSLYLALLLLKAYLAVSYSRSLPVLTPGPLSQEILTIVQPILSGDPLLESQLSANLTALPQQVFLWLIDEEDAEAQRVAELLKRQHPSVNLRVEICPACPDRINPKVWKLERASRLIQTPYFCVLDDDTTLPAASAAQLITAASQHTVATGLPCYLDAGDVPSGLLAQFVNNNSVFTYLATARLVSPFTLNGMGYVLRTEELAGIGHFKPLLHSLTDDLALATQVLRSGGTIHQSPAVLFVQTGLKDGGHYVQMMHRWYVFTLLLMRHQSAAVKLLIFTLHGLPAWLLNGLIFLTLVRMEWRSAALLLCVLLIRRGIIRAMHRRFFQRPLDRAFLSVISEIIQPLHLFHALVSRTIVWRKQHYRVRDVDDFSAV